MNKGLAQYLTFRKRQPWHKQYLNKSNLNWMWVGLSSLGIGAGLMYIFDPDRGKSRRAHAGAKVTSAVNKTGEVIGKTSRDLSNRARGAFAEAGSMFRREDDVERRELKQKAG